MVKNLTQIKVVPFFTGKWYQFRPALKVKASERLQIKCSKDAFDIFMENWDLDSIEHIEEFKLIPSQQKGGISNDLC